MDDERVIEIEVERLRTFEGHPYKVTDDHEMRQLMESIRQYGILNPLIVRPVPEGVYEIIAGHRRKHAAEELGYRKVPVITAMLKDNYGMSVGVMDSYIPFSVKVAEASAEGMSIFQYAPKCKAAESFAKLTSEILEG